MEYGYMYSATLVPESTGTCDCDGDDADLGKEITVIIVIRTNETLNR